MITNLTDCIYNSQEIYCANLPTHTWIPQWQIYFFLAIIVLMFVWMILVANRIDKHYKKYIGTCPVVGDNVAKATLIPHTI